MLLVYLRNQPDDSYRTGVIAILAVLTFLSASAAVGLTRAWAFTRREERRIGQPSPWDMSSIDEHTVPLPGILRDLFFSSPSPGGDDTEDVGDCLPPDEFQDEHNGSPEGSPRSFESFAIELGFTKKAIAVASAEGWHETYGWNDERQATALQMLGRIDDPKPNPTGCRCAHLTSH
jgi:hypothetical protein